MDFIIYNSSLNYSIETVNKINLDKYIYKVYLYTYTDQYMLSSVSRRLILYSQYQ